jgi:hypothetical protein
MLLNEIKPIPVVPFLQRVEGTYFKGETSVGSLPEAERNISFRISNKIRDRGVLKFSYKHCIKGPINFSPDTESREWQSAVPV